MTTLFGELSTLVNQFGLSIGIPLIIIDVLIRIVALGSIPRNRRPASAMAWLMAIFLIPYVGLVFYFVIGSTKLPRKRRKRQEEINTLIAKRSKEISPERIFEGVDPALLSAAHLNRKLSSFPLHTGNDIEVLTDYDDTLAQLTRAVEESMLFVHVEFYILSLDDSTRPFFDALVRAKERGVVVRVLYDHIGSARCPGYLRTLKFLKKHKFHFAAMLPIQPFRGKVRRPDLRNHRKLMVVDGLTAFVGSQNVIDRSYNRKGNIAKGLKWVEVMAKVRGPVVASVDALFSTDWFSETDEDITRNLESIDVPPPAGEFLGQLVPSGPGYESENNLRLFNTLIYTAQQKISITSPYFVPDASLELALTTAVSRGVEVELFVSEASDQFFVYYAQCSYYEQLLRAGVKIYRYPKPYILHSKFFTIDDRVAVLGSSNMDLRSFQLNMELSLMLGGPDCTKAMQSVQDDYRQISSLLDLDQWRKRSPVQKFVESIARLTSALQ